jgi:hypothetical protein
MSTIHQLHAENFIYPHISDLHLVHVYNRQMKKWNFYGYQCSKCQRILKRNIENHHSQCRPLHWSTAEEKDALFNKKRFEDGIIRDITEYSIKVHSNL